MPMAEPSTMASGSAQPATIPAPGSLHDSPGYRYWGYLFRPDKSPTDMLSRLLRGIAACIADEIEPHDNNDLTPSQLACFYHDVGGDYDPLFQQMPYASIAFIYKALNCTHSLQPSNEKPNAFNPPVVPALKPEGFVTWQSVQLLLGPHEHVPFIQRALKQFKVKDPDSGKEFPELLPTECFPVEPDQEMLAWHRNVSETLRRDAMQGPAPTPAGGRAGVTSTDSGRPNSADSNVSNSTADERADAANFFGVSARLKSAQQGIKHGGQMVLNTARQVVSPFNPFEKRDRSSSGDGKRRSIDRTSSRDAKEKERRKSLPSRTASHDRRDYAPGSELSDRRKPHFADQSPGRSSRPPSNQYRNGPQPRRPDPRRRSVDESDASDDDRRYASRPMRRPRSYESPVSTPRDGPGPLSPRYMSDSRSHSHSQMPPRPRAPTGEYGGLRPVLRHHHSSQDTSERPRTDSRPDRRTHMRHASDPRRPPPEFYTDRRTDYPPPRPYVERRSTRRSAPSATFDDDEDRDATPVPASRVRATPFSPPPGIQGEQFPEFSRRNVISSPQEMTPGRPDYFSLKPNPPSRTSPSTDPEANGGRPRSSSRSPLPQGWSDAYPVNNTHSKASQHARFDNGPTIISNPGPDSIPNAGRNPSPSYYPGAQLPPPISVTPPAGARPPSTRRATNSSQLSKGSLEPEPDHAPHYTHKQHKTSSDRGDGDDGDDDEEDNMSEWWNEDDEDESNGGTTRAPGPPPKHKRRPSTLAKQVSAVGGVKGRAYPKEYSWPAAASASSSHQPGPAS